MLTTGGSSTKGAAAASVDSTLEGAGAATTGSVACAVLVGIALACVALIGSRMTGCVASSVGVAGAMCVSGAAALTNEADAGCPQFVQKAVPGSSLAPHDVQKGFVKAAGAAVFASSGASVATSCAASATGAA